MKWQYKEVEPTNTLPPKIRKEKGYKSLLLIWLKTQ